MKTILRKMTFSVLCAGALLPAAAQQLSTDQIAGATSSKTVDAPAKNFVKLNITGLFAKSYGFQYERALSRKFSVALTYRMMPTSSLPFKKTLLDIFTDDQETYNSFENMQVGSTAITPEVRFYVGKKGYGRGFYLAPFYQYTKMEGSGVKVDYNLPNNTKETITLAGSSTAHSAGLVLGTQFALGKRLVLDWWIMGPHYGSSKANLDGRTSRSLSQQEQYFLRQELEDLDFPFVDEEITVSSTGAQIKMDGPWGGVRTGIALGVRF